MKASLLFFQIFFVKKKAAFLCALILCFFFHGSGFANDFSKKEKEFERGILDLSKRKNDGLKTIDLKGEWSFYWNKFLDPKSVLSGAIPKEDGFLKVPSSWKKSEFGNELMAPKGFGSYLLRVKGVPQKMALYFYPGRVKQTSKVFLIQGGRADVIFEAGIPGNKVDKELPQLLSTKKQKVVLEKGDFTLLIHASNFGYRDGGVAIAPRFYSKSNIKMDYFKMFSSGMLLIMVLYHFGLFLKRRGDKAALYFSLICLFMFFRHTIINDHQYFFMAPSYWAHQISVKLEFLGLSLTPFLFAGFLKEIFTGSFQKFFKISFVFSILLSLIVVVFPASVFTKMPFLIPMQINALGTILFGIIRFVILHFKKDKFAGYCLISMGIWFFTVLMDVLIIFNVINLEIKLTQFGFLFWILSQSYILSVKFSNAYETAERLSKDLQKEVKKQTKQAHEARERAEKSEKEVAGLMDNMRQSVFCIGREKEVIAPVSFYSETLFGQKIIGKSIYDVLYKGMDRRKESFGGLEMALSVIFGADDLQFDLLKDQLPTRLIVNTESKKTEKGENKVLKISNNPIFDNEGSLLKLMYVVEDISDVEALEQKMKEQKEEVSKKAGVIQELAGNKKEDLQNFFDDSYELLQLSIDELKRMRSEQLEGESGQKSLDIIFRNSHTLKGNSRIFGLSLISKKSHEVEGVLEVFQKEEGVKDVLENSLKSLYDLRGQVSEYFMVSRDLFGVESQDEIRFKNEIHELMLDFEYWIAQIYFQSRNTGYEPEGIKDLWKKLVDLDEDIREQILSSLVRVLHGLKGLSRALNLKSLSESIHQLEGVIYDFSPSIDKEDESTHERLESAYNEVINLARNLYLKSVDFKPLVLASDQWTELISEFIQIASLYFNGRSEDQKSIINRIYLFNTRASNFRFHFSPSIIRSVYDFFGGSSDSEKNKIKRAFNSIWLYLKWIIQIDIEKSVDFQLRDTLISYFDEDKDHLKRSEIIKKIRLRSDTQNGPILFTIFEKINNQENFLMEDFLLVLEKLEASDDKDFKGRELLERLIPKQDSKSSLGELFLGLKNLFNYENFELITSNNQIQGESIETLKEIINSRHLNIFPYLQSLDFMRVLRSYVYLDEDSDQSRKPNTVDVLMENFEGLKSHLKDRWDDGEIPNWDEMDKFLKHLEDIPVKYSLRKLGSMATEMGKGLGKKVKFVMKGDQASLPKEKLTILKDGIIHLVRNSIDHGIEAPEIRKSLGKDVFGKLEVTLSKEKSGGLSLSISDDGGGIKFDKVLDKAIERGIIKNAEKASLSYQDKVNLIFEPRLSTKEKLTDISGRGIGMDVVKKNIKSLGGSIEVITELNKGTNFIIRLEKIE